MEPIPSWSSLINVAASARPSVDCFDSSPWTRSIAQTANRVGRLFRTILSESVLWLLPVFRPYWSRCWSHTTCAPHVASSLSTNRFSYYCSLSGCAKMDLLTGWHGGLIARLPSIVVGQDAGPSIIDFSLWRHWDGPGTKIDRLDSLDLFYLARAKRSHRSVSFSFLGCLVELFIKTWRGRYDGRNSLHASDSINKQTAVSSDRLVI